MFKCTDKSNQNYVTIYIKSSIDKLTTTKTRYGYYFTNQYNFVGRE